MPSPSPGVPVTFAQVSPGAPNASLQSLTSFIFRHKRFIVYISGSQLNILSGPNQLVHVVSFKQKLVAVAAETATGNIAVADQSNVFVLEPVIEGWTKIRWEQTLLLQPSHGSSNRITHLSWGNEGEILVSGSLEISLYSTLPISGSNTPIESPRNQERPEVRLPLWSNAVSSPIQYAAFSPSASFIATTASRDRLVKIWRRLSYEEKLFDHTYLPHGGSVTHLEWRRSDPQPQDDEEIVNNGRHEEQPEFLYTIATDGLLRVWRTGSVHDQDILILHMTFDLVGAIPQSPSMSNKSDTKSTTATRYAFIVPSSSFCNAVYSRTGLILDGKLSHSLEHLKEMASKASDVVVALDGRNKMSAWGLKSIGHKRRPGTPSSPEAFHIAHAEDLMLTLSEDPNARFQAWFDDATLHVLVHSFSGYVQWWQSSIESFFSTSLSGAERMKLVAMWTGQSRPISSITSHHNDGILTWDDAGEVALWMRNSSHSYYTIPKRIRGEAVADAALFGYDVEIALVTADPPKLLFRDLGGNVPENISLDYCGKLAVQGPGEVNGTRQIVVLSDTGKGILCIVADEDYSVQRTRMFSVPHSNLKFDTMLCRTVLDPGYSDRFGVIQTDTSGVLALNHFDDSNGHGSLSGDQVALIDSGIKEPNILEVNNETAVIASTKHKLLAIVSLRDRYVEHSISATEQEIRQVCLLQEHKLIAVGYETTIEVLASTSYDRVEENLCWVLVRRLSIADTGLNHYRLTWVSDGTLVVAAGSGVFLANNSISTTAINLPSQDTLGVLTSSATSIALSEISRGLSQPLPVWHPRFIEHTFKQGKYPLVVGILRRLHEKLKFWSPGDSLDSLLNIPARQLFGAEEMHNPAELDDDTIQGLTDLLDENALPDISTSEQQTLKLLLKAIVYCFDHVAGLDNNALRYLLAWKLQVLRNDGNFKSNQVNGYINHGMESQSPFVPAMQWRDIAFAYLSTTQQPLLDLLTGHYDNKITWAMVNKLGITAWLNNDALTQIFEALAQSAYRQTSPPDPTNASLYFLALHKKPTLLALWRIATYHKEQRATMKFLQRDFAKAEHQTAAKKNAYALMGKRRFDYAAAFFLLANDAASATSLLAGQCNDVMLAIAVARLYSGDKSAMLAGILYNRLLPEAARSGDRWLMCWCYCVLGRQDVAADALVEPLSGVRRWSQDEPDTLLMFERLRNFDSEHEWDAILRTARIFRRMGLWLPALELVRSWKFRPPPSSKSIKGAKDAVANGVRETTFPSEKNEKSTALDRPDNSSSIPLRPAPNQEPKSILDDFIKSDPAQDDAAARQAKAAELLAKIKAKKVGTTPIDSGEKPKPPPTQFKEPDANSLLDNFGF